MENARPLVPLFEAGGRRIGTATVGGNIAPINRAGSCVSHPFDHRASVDFGDRRRGRSVENARPLALCSRRAATGSARRLWEGTSPQSIGRGVAFPTPSTTAPRLIGDRRRGRSVENARPPVLCSRRAATGSARRLWEGTSPQSIGRGVAFPTPSTTAPRLTGDRRRGRSVENARPLVPLFEAGGRGVEEAIMGENIVPFKLVWSWRRADDPVRLADGTSPHSIGGRVAFPTPSTTAPRLTGDRRRGRSVENARPLCPVLGGRHPDRGDCREHRPNQPGAELRFPPFDHRASVDFGDRRRGRSVENARPPVLCSRRAERPGGRTSPLSFAAERIGESA